MKYFLFIVCLLLSSISVFALTETDKQEQVGRNFYGPNAGFENGVKDITVSGATKNWEGTNKRGGNKAAKCSFTASAQYCETKLVTIPGATLSAQQIWWYYTTATNLKAEILDASNNVIQTINPLPANTGFSKLDLSYVAASGTGYKTRFTTTSATAGSLYIDDGYVGENLTIGSVAQAEWVGDILYGDDCTFSTSSTGFNTLTDGTCSATAVGNLEVLGTVNLGYRLKYPKPGNYKIEITGKLTGTDYSQNNQIRPLDGNGIFWESAFHRGGVAEAWSLSNVIYNHFYSSAPHPDVLIQAGTGGGAALQWGPWDAAQGQRTKISVWRYPSASEQVVRAESSIGLWYGKHENNCGWSLSNASFVDFTADGSCTFTEILNRGMGTVTSSGSKLPGIVFTPSTTGVYEVCAYFQSRTSSTGSAGFQINDGTTTFSGSDNWVPDNMTAGVICFMQDLTSLAQKTYTIQGKTSTGTLDIEASRSAAAINWTIKKLTQQVPMPQIINSVSTTLQGQTVLNSALIAGATETTSICNASPCTVYRETGDWISSVTRAGAGSYVINFNAGVFSQAPVCTCISNRNYPLVCGATGHPSTTSWALDYVYNASTNTPEDGAIHVICHGVK